MFAHKVSSVCRFNVKCANKLCQFRHTNKETASTEKEEDEQETVEVEPIEKVSDDENVISVARCLMILKT